MNDIVKTKTDSEKLAELVELTILGGGRISYNYQRNVDGTMRRDIVAVFRDNELNLIDGSADYTWFINGEKPLANEHYMLMLSQADRAFKTGRNIRENIDATLRIDDVKRQVFSKHTNDFEADYPVTKNRLPKAMSEEWIYDVYGEPRPNSGVIVDDSLAFRKSDDKSLRACLVGMIVESERLKAEKFFPECSCTEVINLAYENMQKHIAEIEKIALSSKTNDTQRGE